MSALNQAIQKSIEAGYDTDYSLEATLLNPDFWMYLGMALTWKENYYKLEIHRFHNHLIEGGDPESFFKTIFQ